MRPPRLASRHRRFSVVSNRLRRSHIEQALARPGVRRWVAIVHDRDPGTATHGHVFVELKAARTVQQIAAYFAVSVIVRPFVGQKGDPHSFARGARYLTHEDSEQRAEGKTLYSDGEVFASPGYDWRTAVDALTASESGVRGPTPRQIKLALLRGELTPMEVRELHEGFYLDHRTEVHRLRRDYWEFGGGLVRQAECDSGRLQKDVALGEQA